MRDYTCVHRHEPGHYCHLCDGHGDGDKLRTEQGARLVVSDAELRTLIRYHLREAKSVARRFGEVALRKRLESFFGSARAIRQLKLDALALIETHGNRARALEALLPKKTKAEKGK